MSPGSARIWPSMLLLRAVLAAVALVSQLLLGSLVLPDEAAAEATAQLRSVAALCTSLPAAPATPTHHRHHPVEPAVCPLEMATGLLAVILMPGIVLPPPSTSNGTRLFVLPAARAPPAAVAWALHARAPPRPA